MKTLLPLLALCFCMTMCTEPKSNQPTISVSIAPLQYITKQITDSDFRFNVLVPSGSSPETYEPTPAQMREVANSQFYIHTGLIDFENNLQQGIQDNMQHVNQVCVSEGIDLIEGDCGHDHAGHHGHGVDPHIWNSPKAVKMIATTIYNALARQYPDSTRYLNNYNLLISRLDTLDAQLTALFEGKEIHFIIYHPALTYLARDYGLRQIALENEGKEPSAQYVRQMIDSARRQKIDKLFYQKQFSQNTVNALADELKIKAVPIDPLAPNVITNTLEISELIANP